MPPEELPRACTCAETPISPERTRFLKALVDTARSLDGSRLISAAMEVHAGKQNPDLRIVDDPFGELTNLVSFDQYIGWYDGLPEETAKETPLEVRTDGEALIIRPQRKTRSARLKAAAKRMMEAHDDTLRKLAK